MSERRAIGIDVGGTKVAALVVDCGQGGRILDDLVVDTPAHDAEAAASTIIEAVGSLLARTPDVMAIGVGAAGMVDRQGMIHYAPNVAWRDFPLGRRISEGVGLPTMVDNDANMAAWAEYRFGAAQAVRNVLMVTVGTGIGGGIIVDGRLFRGANGFAAEIGHIIVEPDGPECGCGNRGCWEQVASGRALGRLGRAAARAHPGTLMLELAGGSADGIDGPTVTAAAGKGDAAALAVVDEVGRRLGEGLAGLVNVLDPEMVVVGGGVSEAGELLLGPARRAFRDAVEGAGYRPEVPIVVAILGNEAGAVGAADLAFLELALP